jgi:transposase-like protein
LDEAVQQFHSAPLQDDWAYLFLDGVSLRSDGLAAASGCRCWWPMVWPAMAGASCWPSNASKGESQSAWEGLLRQLHQRGLTGHNLQLIITDGCAGLAAGIEVVYPRVLHQKCWVHKMRNIPEKVRKRDYEEVKAGARAIYRAEGRRAAQTAFAVFRTKWKEEYPSMVKQLERDLPELLSFFAFPHRLRRKLRTTNLIERIFVEVRRRTRPMVCFVNVASVDRIIYSIFQRFNLEWKNRTLRIFTQAA